MYVLSPVLLNDAGGSGWLYNTAGQFTLKRHIGESSIPGQISFLVSLAVKNFLMVSCFSLFHINVNARMQNLLN